MRGCERSDRGEIRGKGEARKRAIIHSRRRRRELSRRRIRLVVMHRVTRHAVKQGYQFAVHASLVRVARRGRSLFPLTGCTERIGVARMTRSESMPSCRSNDHTRSLASSARVSRLDRETFPKGQRNYCLLKLRGT